MHLNEGMAMVEGGVAKAEELGYKVSIAIVDSRGDLVIHMRTDGVSRYAADMAFGKAVASAVFESPTSALDGEAPANRRLNEVAHGRLTFVQGGVPVYHDGEQLGGIGVAGSKGDITGDIEEQIAEAAAAGYGTHLRPVPAGAAA